MTITFNTNLSALTAQRYIGKSSSDASSSLSKLSSGSRIPQAKDDAAGLAIGSKLKAEIAGLTQASNNAAQANSLLQIADGALSTIGDMLVRMKSLATQSSSGQLGDSERAMLNQEFSNLQSEISRIATTSNFNGTKLLSGSTVVTGNINNLAAYSSTNSSSGSSNLLGEGFSNVEFADDFGNGAIRVKYDGTTRIMTVTDLVQDKSESITLASGAIAAGDTETYNFGNIGVKFTLNNLFSKSTSINATNTAYSDPAVGNFTLGGFASVTSAGAQSIVLSASSITAINFNGTGSDEFYASQLDLASVAVSGAANAAVFTATIGGRTFTSAAANISTVAAHGGIVLSDGHNNSFTISVTTGTAPTAASDAITAGTLTLTQTAGGVIENSANSVSLVSVHEADTAASAFDFGLINNAKISIDGTAANAATGSITIGGHTFTSANNGGTTVNLTTTGTKTLTLSDSATAATANRITITFNVTRAFGNGDDVDIDMAQFGQVIGARSATTNSTAFDFKVGTGVTLDDSISFSLSSATASALGVDGDDIETATAANTAIGNLNTAIARVSSYRADIGANQSRLDFASSNISVAIENTTAATSAIMDVDVSSEITTFTSKNVLMQAGISLLGQANQQPSLLLGLLR